MTVIMGVLGWTTMIGGLLLLMALLSAYVERLPISTSFIYLVVGVALGPAGFGLLTLDLATQGEWLEVLTEIAVNVSLFVGGLRLRLPLRDASWRIAARLAGPVMLLAIAGTALISHYLFGITLLLGVVLGGVLAPTDPVLAAAISVNDAEDHDRVRVALSGEAGLNDGAAFPFVMFALEAIRIGTLGAWVAPWTLLHVVWGILGGLAIGYLLGISLGHVTIRIRSLHRETSAPNDFLALALIALAYVAAESVSALGFLAVFAAGVGLRHAEVRVVRDSPHPDVADAVASNASNDVVSHPPAETLVPSRLSEQSLEEPAMAAGLLISDALSFGDTLERLLEVGLVVLVGIVLVQYWSFTAALLAILLFFVIRPLSVLLLLRGTRTSLHQRLLIGWFGIRGIGSLFYLAYALNHGITGGAAELLVQVVITVIACSVVVHGISVTPILARYEASLAKRHATA
ncbi:MAG TPA: cation:proton antiporter [Gemmatimonadaceae bacterium]|nr:cation:proton antiporter [Gemmatimonadaceae bacterium]